MTTIELDFEFMEALNTLDLTRVQATRKYREMCEAASRDCQKVDGGIAHMIEQSRKKRDRNPRVWAAIVETTAQYAAQERATRCEHIAIRGEATVSIDDRFRVDSENPRGRRQS